jgi:hypothetical protein
MLIARGVCNNEALREAWEQKILFGDRLGTNLMALNLVREKDLARALGEQHGLHAGFGSVINVDDRVLPLVPRELAKRRSIVAHHVSGRTLFVLVMDPPDRETLEELRFAADNLKIAPVIVCEARMWHLLQKHYSVRRGLRPIDLDNTRIRKPEPAKPKGAAPKKLASTEELTSEDEFNALYASLNTGGPRRTAQDALDVVEAKQADERAKTGPQPALVPPPSVLTQAAIDEAPAPLIGLAPPLDFQAPVVDAELPPPPVGLSPPVEEASDWRAEIEHTQASRVMPLTAAEMQLIRAIPLPTTPPPPAVAVVEEPAAFELTEEVEEVADETPLSFAEATELLQHVKDRTQIAHIVLRCARNVFTRACLLTVHPYHLVGWVGIGEGLETEKLRNFAIERSERSVFSLVTSSRAHYIGPLQKWTAHGTWVKATGRMLPRSVAVFPILVKGRTVNVLYGDRGHGEHVGGDVSELLILAQQIARSYESLLGGL